MLKFLILSLNSRKQKKINIFIFEKKFNDKKFPTAKILEKAIAPCVLLQRN